MLNRLLILSFLVAAALFPLRFAADNGWFGSGPSDTVISSLCHAGMFSAGAMLILAGVLSAAKK